MPTVEENKEELRKHLHDQFESTERTTDVNDAFIEDMLLSFEERLVLKANELCLTLGHKLIEHAKCKYMDALKS